MHFINMWAKEKWTSAPVNRTRDLKIARPMLDLTTTDTTRNDCFLEKR